ncbi:MAG: sulfur oxidation c-type cytochrome SoxX [Alphaproteobacteria bacterium]|nr:sulfur oxidation c-type cytochrome SoxX [Alphaproteobacteria bacterium]
MPRPGSPPSRPRPMAERGARRAILLRAATLLGATLLGATLPAAIGAARAQVVPFAVVEDGIPAPLGGEAGDAARGRAIVADRQKGLCVLCHSGPFPELRFMGNLAPGLEGAGARWSEAQLRLRIADPSVLAPDTIMPAYHRAEGLRRVGAAHRGRPILTAREVEDVVAFLATLK